MLESVVNSMHVCVMARWALCCGLTFLTFYRFLSDLHQPISFYLYSYDRLYSLLEFGTVWWLAMSVILRCKRCYLGSLFWYLAKQKSRDLLCPLEWFCSGSPRTLWENCPRAARHAFLAPCISQMIIINSITITVNMMDEKIPPFPLNFTWLFSFLFREGTISSRWRNIQVLLIHMTLLTGKTIHTCHCW